MTISSEVRKAGPYAGNDATTEFPFSFKVFSNAEVVVVEADSDGVETELELGIDYTVSLNANQNAMPGGKVTLTNPLPSGNTLVLTSAVEAKQPLELTNQGGFYPAVINAALDRLTILVQQLRVDVDRSAKLPLTREEDADELLADVVLIADNMAIVQTVADNIVDVKTVAGIASDITSVAASAENIDAVAADLANVNTVAANIGSVNATAPEIDSVVEVAEHMSDILAALADLPSLAAKVSKTGDTMTGHLEVPAGASGAEVPQAQEVVLLTGDQTVDGVKTFTSSPIVPGGATGDQAIRAEEVAMAPLSFPAGGKSAVDITSVPSWINEFSIVFSNIVVAGSTQIWIRLGTSDGVSSTNYAAIQAAAVPAAAPAIAEVSTHIPVRSDGTNANIVRGHVTFRRSLGDSWMANGIMYRNDDKAIIWVVGLCSLSGTLDRIRLMTNNASNFTGGTFLLSWRR